MDAFFSNEEGEVATSIHPIEGKESITQGKVKRYRHLTDEMLETFRRKSEG